MGIDMETGIVFDDSDIDKYLRYKEKNKATLLPTKGKIKDISGSEVDISNE